MLKKDADKTPQNDLQQRNEHIQILEKSASREEDERAIPLQVVDDGSREALVTVPQEPSEEHHHASLQGARADQSTSAQPLESSHPSQLTPDLITFD